MVIIATTLFEGFIDCIFLVLVVKLVDLLQSFPFDLNQILLLFVESVGQLVGVVYQINELCSQVMIYC